MNKTIVFDLGGVLIDWNPRYLYASYFETEESMEYFLNNICTMEWNEEQDAGRSIQKANEHLTNQFPEYSTEIEAYYAQWETMLGGQIDETVEILKHLREKHENVYALTNWSAETFPFARKRFSFLSWFDGILVSGEEHLKKPDPKIYQLLIQRFGLKAENCLFIDDSQKNVDAAIKEGISSIRYTSPDQLKVQLNQHGIEV